MKNLIALIFVSLFLTAPLAAQDTTYEFEDEIAMQQCIETIRDINADPDTVHQASLRDCIGTASSACQDIEADGYSTFGMMRCTERETAWWDWYLNSLYGELRTSLEPALFDDLRETQRAWIAYRDANCAFAHQYWIEGTIRVLFASGCMLQMTAERAIDLAEIIDWAQ